MAVTTTRDAVLSCPVCNSTAAEDYDLIGLASQPGPGQKDYEVLRCRAHDVVFASRMPAASSDSGNDGHASLDLMYGRELEPQSRYIDFMNRVQRVAPNAGVLHDEGCGNGQLMVEAERRGWVVEGNDVVASAVERLSRSGYACYLGSLADINLPPEAVDVITSYCVLPHLLQPRPGIEAVYRRLKPGGWFVAELPRDGLYRRAAWWLYRLSGGRWKGVLAQLHGVGGHQFAYSEKSVRALLESVGFVDVRVEPFYLDPKWSARRFETASWRMRCLGLMAVYTLFALTYVFRLANHMFVYARRPHDAV